MKQRIPVWRKNQSLTLGVNISIHGHKEFVRLKKTGIKVALDA